METLKPDAPLVTREPTVLLDPLLPEGVYRVQLIVESSRGKSAPATMLIKVFKE
jgi:hypothetical protein